jgi:serine/threonine protein kinase
MDRFAGSLRLCSGPVAEDKKTQMGTGDHPGVTGTPVPAAGTPAPVGEGALATQMVSSAQVPAISSPPVSKPPSSAFHVSQPNVDPLIGQTLADRYYVQKKLGEGGMGAVYLATHKVLEKQVALKVLHGEFARKQDLVERFMQEAKAASRIRHENVIDVSDFGSTPDGLVFFAMEMLKGNDLHDLIARARIANELLPWDRTKRIFLQICSALSAAHAAGIVHRDLKPENIFLVEFLGDTDFVKLLDFGIAKLTEVNEEGRKLTRTGMLFGTPEYMSPEQARGDTADHRVDVYAMGCILFQLLTTRVPFEAENFMSVLSLHLTEPPPQIPDEVFDAVGAPRELAGVIDKALEKDRNERWQTMDELANAVREVSGDDPVAPRGTKEQPAIRATNAQPIAAPAQTKIPRPKTEAPRKTTGKAAAADAGEKKPTPRPRTQWTGTVKVQDEMAAEEPRSVAEPRAPKASKMPLFIGAAIIVAGGAVAAAVMMSGKKEAGPVVLPPPPGSNVAQNGTTPPVTPDAGMAVTIPQGVPALVVIHFDSTPQKAEILDLDGKVVGYTPYPLKIPGNINPQQFKIRLAGYEPSIVTVPLDKPDVIENLALVKLGGGGIVRPPPQNPGNGSAVTKIPVDAGVVPMAIDAAAPKPPPVDALCVPDPMGIKPCM